MAKMIKLMFYLIIEITLNNEILILLILSSIRNVNGTWSKSYRPWCRMFLFWLLFAKEQLKAKYKLKPILFVRSTAGLKWIHAYLSSMLTSKSSSDMFKFLWPVRSVQIGVTLHDSSAEYWKEHLMVTESFCFKKMFTESVNFGSTKMN